MNDLIFINNLESTQLNQHHQATYVSPPSSAKPGVNSPDCYAEGSEASCSVHSVNSGSAFALWRLLFRLFGSE